MKCAIILMLLTTTITSCNRWRIPDSDNKYLEVLKRDGNLTKTKARLASDIRVEAIVQDTVTSSVSKGKATIMTTTRKGVTIPENTKGDIVEENGSFYFVFNDDEYKKKVGRLPLNVDKSEISIMTNKYVMIGTNLMVDSQDPGFELRIKEDKRTESIKAN